MPALQSTNPASCAWLKWAKALDTSCFQADNRSGQDMSVLLDNEADMHFLIIIADHSCSCLLFPPKTLYLKALSPIAAAGPQSTSGKATSFHTTVKTTDGKFTTALTIDPNTAGPNIFTVEVRDTTTGQPSTDVGVSLYTTHLDMNMGTDTVNLQPDGKGRFSATGDLVMGGHWQIRIQIRTSDTTLHEATVKV